MNNMPDPAKLQEYMKEIDFPAERDDIIEKAREQGADQRVVDFLERMPDHTYASPEDITREIGGDASDSAKGMTDRY